MITATTTDLAVYVEIFLLFNCESSRHVAVSYDNICKIICDDPFVSYSAFCVWALRGL